MLPSHSGGPYFVLDGLRLLVTVGVKLTSMLGTVKLWLDRVTFWKMILLNVLCHLNGIVDSLQKVQLSLYC